MYETYFNLRVKPFELVPDPHFIFLSKSHKKALSFLNYGIQERSGFILLTGEIGSGKTTLIRDLYNKHNERVVLAKIFNTCVTSEQLLAMINDDFGLPVQGRDKVTLISDLNSFLVEQYALGNQPTLIIDEAQNLGADLLEEIRMLSNLETDDCKLLQIILVGQPELRTILAAPKLLQLRQRININCHIQALNRLETEQYITHRLDVAGNATAVVFPSETLDYIFHYSKGIPRLINIICDFLLLSAFAEETNTIDIEMVREIIGDLDFENHYWSNADSDKETAHPTDSAKIPVNEAHASCSLVDISRRVESMEKNFAHLQSTLIVSFDQLAGLQDAFEAFVNKIDDQAADINKRQNETLLPGHASADHALPDYPASNGIIRRIFGSNSSGK
jgi:general secretion pathway protein A